MLLVLLLAFYECIWNCFTYLTVSVVCALWLGFTLAKNKERKKKEKKRQRLQKELRCPNHPCNQAGSLSLSGVPQAVTQRGCTSRLEIREDRRVLPVQIWNQGGTQPPLAPALSCSRGSASAASKGGQLLLCKLPPLPLAFLQCANTFGAPAGPSACADFYAVWTIKHLDSQAVHFGELDLIYCVLASVTDLEVFLC